jgi:hypothetical protein
LRKENLPASRLTVPADVSQRTEKASISEASNLNSTRRSGRESPSPVPGWRIDGWNIETASMVSIAIARHLRSSCTRQAELCGDYGELSCVWRISIKKDVADAGVPDPGERVASFVRDYNEPFRIQIQRRQITGAISIDHYYAIQPQVRLIHQVYPMCAITQEQVAKRLRVFRVSDSELDGPHTSPSLYEGHWLQSGGQLFSLGQTTDYLQFRFVQQSRISQFSRSCGPEAPP